VRAYPLRQRRLASAGSPPRHALPHSDALSPSSAETTQRRRSPVGNNPKTNTLDKALFSMALRLERVKV